MVNLWTEGKVVDKDNPTTVQHTVDMYIFEEHIAMFHYPRQQTSVMKQCIKYVFLQPIFCLTLIRQFHTKFFIRTH